MCVNGQFVCAHIWDRRAFLSGDGEREHTQHTLHCAKMGKWVFSVY